jgi:sugar phosphate permease
MSSHEMVYTHLTFFIFLLLLPFEPRFCLAITMIALRAYLSSMDQSPSSAFLSTTATPKERMKVIGLVSVSKTIGLGLGFATTGFMARGGLMLFGWTFLVSGGLKCLSDVALFIGFTSVETWSYG